MYSYIVFIHLYVDRILDTFRGYYFKERKCHCSQWSDPDMIIWNNNNIAILQFIGSIYLKRMGSFKDEKKKCGEWFCEISSAYELICVIIYFPFESLFCLTYFILLRAHVLHNNIIYIKHLIYVSTMTCLLYARMLHAPSVYTTAVAASVRELSTTKSEMKVIRA